jgi:hypothetical protein
MVPWRLGLVVPSPPATEVVRSNSARVWDGSLKKPNRMAKLLELYVGTYILDRFWNGKTSGSILNKFWWLFVPTVLIFGQSLAYQITVQVDLAHLWNNGPKCSQIFFCQNNVMYNFFRVNKSLTICASSFEIFEKTAQNKLSPNRLQNSPNPVTMLSYTLQFWVSRWHFWRSALHFLGSFFYCQKFPDLTSHHWGCRRVWADLAFCYYARSGAL